ncbi:multicopper oxidase [Teladorsagia circumcincta]|uniref:Multicopper oxidase n=1 Tax=Teladorsagia circumcincta TaxID=45464 RepID=A0A2G9UMH4_TELCI|nr:multicopper oxidase [Teladorsagia circumcincta]
MCYDKLRHPKSSEIDKDILKDTPFTEGYEEHFINMHFDSHVDGFKYEFPLGMPYYYKDDMALISKDCKKVNCSRTANKYDENCNCFYHLKHKLNNIVQITLYNMGTGGAFTTGYAHPFHIHGHHFYVMKDICDGAVWRNKSWMNGAVEGMNTVNPSLRDTITLPVGGYIVIRFRATNPGWWFAHCHLELHAMSGTAYAFQVGEHEDIAPPPANFPRDCGAFTMPKLEPRHSTGGGRIKPQIYTPHTYLHRQKNMYIDIPTCLGCVLYKKDRGVCENQKEVKLPNNQNSPD